MSVSYVPYKIISCSSENPSHSSSGVYQTFDVDNKYWETLDVQKAELVVGFSTLTSIRTVVIG